jgi:DNA-binding transcriptional LysR family regulator
MVGGGSEEQRELFARNTEAVHTPTVSAITEKLRHEPPTQLQGNRHGHTSLRRSCARASSVLMSFATVASPFVQEVFDPPRAFDPATARDRIVLSLPDVAQLVFLPRLLEELKQRAPGITVRIVQGPQDFDAGSLERGDVDLVASLQRPLPPGLHGEDVIPSTPMACLLRRGHRARRLTLRRYLALPHVAVGGPGLMSRAIAERGLTREIVLRVSSFLVVPWIVAESDMVATLPRWIAQRFSGGRGHIADVLARS